MTVVEVWQASCEASGVELEPATAGDLRGSMMSNSQAMFYVAADPSQPGAAWAACVDKPEYAKDTARDLAYWVRSGAKIERVDAVTMQGMLAAWTRPEKKRIARK